MARSAKSRTFESHYDRYRPEPRQRWRELPGPGSGIWFDLGAHLADQALQLFGPPEAIYADLEMQRPRRPGCGLFSRDTSLWPQSRNFARRVAGGCRNSAIRGSWRAGKLHKIRDGPAGRSVQARRDSGRSGMGTRPADGNANHQERRRLRDAASSECARELSRAITKAIRDAISLGAPNPVTPEQALEVINVLETGVKSSAARAEMPFTPIKL